MGEIRKIDRYFNGNKAEDGAGVSLYRTFGYHEIPDFDPFLMMDFFDSENPEDYTKGFPWHPHRGIETVTYLISGEIEHEDSIGNKGTIYDGDCQWMTAGSGIMHQEMPKASPKMLGIQLWVNLPKKDKMTDPKYRDIRKEMIPEYKDENMTVKVLAGKFKGIEGPIEGIDAEPIFLDVELVPNSEFEFQLDSSFNVFTFLVGGEANFNTDKEEIVSHPKGVLYKEGDYVRINTKENGGRFLLIAGKPLNEPISWGGPIVMNTKEELDLAFKEISEGSFIKKSV
ncbi:pirin domain-containing protein [Gottschalkia acidurici 9a]|uniref:Pirin domain-containing protein n=1 Tax=Gottschalkia acidurici (strain ATCC 7906 / DSM 604 / BCRC 14475 / CIP 104303 / KCTC 5404 / NCIMB 10678 / 9a) TaxID=1128398 RepID=K0AY26_GOTA9|nr:pirin family protein [Gottschalkia acidurici]AFS77655.1 pirin domain-containing protein [Gottschalkia acidurici 9a]